MGLELMMLEIQLQAPPTEPAGHLFHFKVVLPGMWWKPVKELCRHLYGVFSRRTCDSCTNLTEEAQKRKLQVVLR